MEKTTTRKYINEFCFKSMCEKLLFPRYAKKPYHTDVLRDNMDQSGVHLWVKAEPFIVGALQVPPPSKFSLHYLRKISTYVRTRATEGAYPRLYWSTWRHIACGKLQLAKDLAWLYFEIFDSLAVKTPEERLEWSEILSNCMSEDEIEKQRNKVWIYMYVYVCLIILRNKLSLIFVLAVQYVVLC